MDPAENPGSPAALYRLDSNQSSTSVFDNVEMAQDELFSGPMAESLPTSTSAFAHRRTRTDSVTSFAYYNEEDDDADADDADDPYRDQFAHQFVDRDPTEFLFDHYSDDDQVPPSPDEGSAHYGANPHTLPRRHSTVSASDPAVRLLRQDSATTAGSHRFEGRPCQKIYLANEDLTIAVAGFRNRAPGLFLYRLLCILTCGLAYLLFRWLPPLYVKLVGRSCGLADCDWVVIENQWAEFAIAHIVPTPYGRSMSTVFGISEKPARYGLEEDDMDPVMPQLRLLNYRYIRLAFHPRKDKFVLLSGWKDPSWTDTRSVRAGIDTDEKAAREAVFGTNLIDIEQKSTLQLLVDEVLHPFYIFQVASLILWSLEEYWYYAMCIFIMSVASITATLVDTRTTMKRLREISRFECDVRVLRNGFWRYVSSSELVPGDLYEVSDPSLTQFPSDSLLLSGDCIVNESMLTGESVPVTKSPASDETLSSLDLIVPTMSPEIARHFLFSGTKIIRSRRPQDDHQSGDAVALALVVRTGFNTTKGSLVRSMLFPKPSGFKFYRDSFRYITVMALIAFAGFAASLVNFVRLGISWQLIIIRTLDLVTIAVPPALPVTLTIGTSFSVSRLKKKLIYCISPQRVNVGGKLDIVCFDKTGTLTEEGLDVLGVRVVIRRAAKFTDLLASPDHLVSSSPAEPETELETRLSVLYAMATCHSLRSVDGELVGDPLDLKMFQFTGWNFQEGNQVAAEHDAEDQGGLSPPVARPPTDFGIGTGLSSRDSSVQIPVELGVLRSFEFASNLRRASVLVRQFGQKSGDIYVKGAPECMRDICRPESFPPDYDGLLAYYTHKGYRVIGCATRHIKKLSWVKAQKMSRSEVECDLDFAAFIIFENKLKPTTTAVLDELQRSNIRTVMVTGDNILTAVSVARECRLLDQTAHCFVPRFSQGHARNHSAVLEWESIDNPLLRLDSETLLPLPVPVECDASLPLDIANIQNYSLAVSGDVFRWIVDFAPAQVLQRMLVRGSVFARMSPDEKHELVEKLQSIDYCCGFCGDGANDCGALKAADVGISLSEAEASVAAPFTSRIFDISCVPDVIREGRASLVTSFSCFKYMSLYSAIQFTTVSFLYASASNLADFQFLFIDVFLILPIAVLMSRAEPYPVLSPRRPTAKLVSRKVLVPLLGQIAICVAVQAAAYVIVRRQPWYIPPKLKHNKTNVKNSDNTALFFMSCFEYILAGVMLNAGPPFRQPAKKNLPFIVTVAASLLVSVLMMLGPGHFVKKLMELTKTSWDFDLVVIGLGGVYIVAGLLCEHVVFPAMVRYIGWAKEYITGRVKRRKAYKVIGEGARV